MDRRWLPLNALRAFEAAGRALSFTAAERMRKKRHKMSADDKDFLNARRRQRNRKIKIDPLTAAFFGGMR